MKKFSRLVVIIILLISFSITPSFSVEQKDKILAQKSTHLSSLIVSIENISAEIKKTQAILASPESLGREKAVKFHIDSLDRKLSSLDESFDLLATGVDYKTSPGNLKSGFNWSRELQVLFGPLIAELQQLTSKPREIEKLKSDIAFYERHIQLANTAIKNLDKLLSVSKKSDALQEKLADTIEKWSHRKNEWEALKNIGIVHLEQKKGDQSISKSIQDIPKIFFKSHGRNTLIALFVFCFSAFSMFQLYRLIKKINPIRSKGRSLYGRVFDLGYIFLAIIVAILTTLASLYLFNDWVVLSVVLIFIFGIAWASKHAFSKIWFQIKLILNLGPVREGEVVVYQRLLYRVVSINLYTTLSNPFIQGGVIRVPLDDIIELRSRPVVEDEPWFPSEKGDWVVIDDDRHGKVVTQTPETVKLKFPGGGEKSFVTGDYLSLSPMNLSSGFRISIVFGLDYDLQNKVTDEIPVILQKGIVEILSDTGYLKFTSSVRVHFRAASASSLDLDIIIDCNNTAGRQYRMLPRVLQKACVDVCNEQDWAIPFTQMTVHVENSN